MGNLRGKQRPAQDAELGPATEADVVGEHVVTLPPDLRQRVRLSRHDATRWCLHERDAFDAILLDAPCSSERHVIKDGLLNKRAEDSPFHLICEACRPLALPIRFRPLSPAGRRPKFDKPEVHPGLAQAA